MVMGAKDHDRVIGAVSHLPHVVAAALVKCSSRDGGYLPPI